MPFRKRGSAWGRWDLHFHTPTSYDYKNQSVTNEQIISTLKTAGVEVVAITDHHVIDVARIRELQQLAGEDLTVLPGIEFRTELGGKEKVHLIGIFPEDCNLTDLWTKLSGSLKLTAEDLAKKGGDESIYADFREASALIRELGGIVTTHAGGKTNSIESIKNNAPFKMALKTDLARECVDIYELGKPSDRDDYEKIVFPKIDKRLPLILGSDNHDINHYETKAICWIKGDPSFRTFQQLITDPHRAFIGEIPPENLRVESNPTKYVSEIRFEKKAQSKLAEEWFSGTVELNPGLVAIIGNKGSGKTALAEAIGLLGNCTSEESFSFLNERKFRQPRNNKAREFDATLTWRSGYPVTRSLADHTDPNAPPEVSYIPQSYLEEICNEVNNLPGGAFDRELKSVIFSHVPEDKRLNTESLDDLLTYQTEPLEQRLETLRGELTELNRTILDLEQRNSTSNRQLLANQKATKERELEAHEGTKPTEVPIPEADAKQQEMMEAAGAKIKSADEERAALKETIEKAQAQQNSASGRLASARRIEELLKNLEAAHRTLIANIKADCKVIDVSPESLATLKTDHKPLKSASADAQKLSDEQAALIAKSKARTQELSVEIAALAEELDAPNAAYQRYLESLRTWTERREELIGSPEKRESLSFYEQEIKNLDKLPEAIVEARTARDEKVKELFRQIREIVYRYRELYHPVQEFIMRNQVAQQKFHLEFDASIVSVNTDQTILSLVNLGRKGTFSGVDDGKRTLKALLETADLQTEAGVVTFTKAVEERFYADYRFKPPAKMNLVDQLRQGAEPVQLLDSIFGLSYLRPKYQLKWSGKDIEELSPGERGTLLLIFYLLIDRRDVPLIIDQPEDNLDNQTVYDLLVACLREARKRRQVIIVTHNPNLAVVCDADQIIHSQRDKQGKNRVKYTTGSIENPVTNLLTITVLEGTRPAFVHRDRKYHED